MSLWRVRTSGAFWSNFQLQEQINVGSEDVMIDMQRSLPVASLDSDGDVYTVSEMQFFTLTSFRVPSSGCLGRI